MATSRNTDVTIECEVCAEPFNPWFGREHFSRVCSRACNGKLPKPSVSNAPDDFESFIEKTDDCWEWRGPRNAAGYGMFGIGGRRIRAHRFSYERAAGPISDGLVICHRCDNPGCVNPAHLWAGTQGDNAADMAAKKRAHKGPSRHSEAHPLSKITAPVARAIRADTRSHAEVARAYGVSPSLVGGIKRGTHWKYA